VSGSQHSTSRAPRVRKRDYEEAAALRAALRRFLRESESSTKESGLTVEQYELLLLIKTAHNGTATVGGLHRALARRQSGVTQLVRRVEKLGLVSRELSDRDARVRFLRLTEEGERRLAHTVARLRKERARLLTIDSDMQG
jgi:DNA-binding MarR family transcriptional regulator